jgi:hypothetical protein
LVPSSGAQKTQANYCTICCTIPDTGGWLAGSLALSSTQRDDVKADRQWENLKILAKSAQVSDRKTVAPRSRYLRKCRFYLYLASAVRWPSGRRRRFAKAARNHRTGLKLTISGPFFIGNLVGVGCRLMVLGPRLGTLRPMPTCALWAHIVLFCRR